MKQHIGNFVYKLNIGKVRVTNEDNADALINSRGDILLVICDGMGGYKKGDFASKIVIDYLKDAFLNRKYFLNRLTAISWINSVVKKANKEIFKYAQQADYKDMGTTIVLALISGGFVLVAYAGDSRCYFYGRNKLEQVTKDQTYANYLFKIGKIKEEDILTSPHRHVLTNAIGIFPSVNLDYTFYKYTGQNILLCSDGLYNNLSAKDILACITTTENVEDKADTLIACANANGGSDNIAVVLWEGKE